MFLNFCCEISKLLFTPPKLKKVPFWQKFPKIFRLPPAKKHLDGFFKVAVNKFLDEMAILLPFIDSSSTPC